MIVSIGGGSGHSTILSALKKIDYIVAIVAITDDGGSSGKIKKELGMPPPGDVRNCIISLAEDQEIMGELMQHRFTKGFLSNHTVGNIIIAGLTEIYNNFSQAVSVASDILKIRGKVLPVYSDILNLGASFEDGKIIWGETSIREYGGEIKEIFIDKKVKAEPETIEHIENSNLIVIGPGSLYTSIITNFLVKGVRESILKSKAKVVYIQNLFTEPGETSNYTAAKHLNVLNKYFPISRIDYIFLNTGKPPEEIIKRYEKSGKCLVNDDLENNVHCKIIRDNFISVKSNVIRHSALKIGSWIKKILEEKI